MPTSLSDLIAILQASIAPCLLISGVGLLLLSMTNRLGRPIDRIYQVHSRLAGASPERQIFLKRQLAVLFKRCRILQAAIGLAALCIFLLGVIILLLFAAQLRGMLWASGAVELLFAASVLCLIGSLGFFLWDIGLMLASLELLVAEPTEPPRS